MRKYKIWFRYIGRGWEHIPYLVELTQTAELESRFNQVHEGAAINPFCESSHADKIGDHVLDRTLYLNLRRIETLFIEEVEVEEEQVEEVEEEGDGEEPE